MNYLRRSNQRGQADFGWLDSRHTFSFGQYHDAEHMGLSSLRVINEDRVAPGAGFGTHGHRDMEIISYVISGAMRHEDSMGNQFVLPAGEVQRMSAGSGVMHSEFNDSATEPVHFLQIWIAPDRHGIDPEYEQKQIVQKGPLTVLVSPDAREGSLSLHQDATLYRLQLAAGESTELGTVAPGRTGFLQLIEGVLAIDELTLAAGDGYGFDAPLSVTATQTVEAIFFDLPPQH